MLNRHVSNSGLRIVLEELPHVRSVTIGIWVLAGSRNETIDNNGISHYIEHMLFKGTKTRSAKEIAEAFDSIGGQINAFTSKEYTCYYARVLDTHKEYAIEILADMFFNSVFDEEDMEKEKDVVYEEIKMYDDAPDDIVHDLLAKASFGDHPLGYPILGTEKQLKTFSKETIRDYMNERYTPDNIVISIAGNVDDSFIPTVEGYFNQFDTTKKRSDLIKPQFMYHSLKKEKDTEQAHLCLGYNGLPLGDEDMYSLIIMNSVFGGSMSSRLFQEVREKQGLAYSVFSYHSTFLDNGMLTIYAGTGVKQLAKLQETMKRTIDELLQKGITDKELINSKEQLKGNLVLGLESTSSRMSRNGKNELLLNKHRTLNEIIQEIDGVTHSSVKRTISRIFDQEASTALIGPKSI